MTKTADIDIEQILSDTPKIESALRRATQGAVLKHKQLGHPVVVWRDGKVELISPEDIKVVTE